MFGKRLTLSILVYLWSVSYTHLDVYKRQALEIDIILCQFATQYSVWSTKFKTSGIHQTINQSKNYISQN